MTTRASIFTAVLLVSTWGTLGTLAQQPQPQESQQTQPTQAAASPAVSQTPATTTGGALANQDIIKLSQIGLGPDVIIFSLSTEDIIALRQANVNQEVITAMMKRATALGTISGRAAIK